MKIVFATNNKHKLDEIRNILGLSFEVLSLNDLGCHDDIPETGSTLEENARQKAQYIYDKYHCNVFADDTGLEVEALGGEPGVYSARYAAIKDPDAASHDSEANMTTLLKELEGKDNRNARFRTVISLILTSTPPTGGQGGRAVNGSSSFLFSGIVEGEIIRERRGGEGFGYDPIFQPKGYDKTFAELGNDIKNKISHRACAVAKLAAHLKKQINSTRARGVIREFKIKKQMKKALIALITLASITLSATAAIGDWKIYMAYSEPQQIQETGNYLFVQASNSLYLYNKNDQSIQTFDKTTGMSDVVVTNISWNQQAKRLAITYDNSNIDLMDLNGNVVNIPDLYNKTMTDDKTINSINNNGKYAYIATNFGGIKLDMAKAEVSESYLLGESIKRFAVSGSTIYAQTTQNKVISASLSANLQDKANWTPTPTYPAGIFDEDKTAYNNNIELVKTLNPGGPKNNQFGYMRFKNGALYTCTGTDWNFSQPATIQILKDEEWDIYKDDYIPEMTGQKYWDIMCLDVYGNKLAAGTRNGVYIFEDGILKEFYNHEKSILETFSNSGNPNYVLITSLTYDNKGNLWIFNSAAPSQSIIELKPNGTMVAHKQSELMVLEDRGIMKSARKMTSSFIDSDNNLWFVNFDWIHSSTFRYDINNDRVYDFFTYKNQDGAEISNLHYFKCIVEDKQNDEFVIGTDVGLLFLPKNYIDNPTKGFVQFKVPRNDGTNLADYLMSGIDITCIAIDGGGRKWIGTNGAGVFVISQDKLTQTLHLESNTSNLLSDIILSIAIDNDNGEVFIGTEKGLCSYMSDATTPNEDLNSDNVYAYPNPVEPDYTGMIMVRGLPNNSDIKILSSNGAIVAEGKSNGGSFMWDGCNKNGNRVASGVYMVAIAGSGGEKGTVCKIAVIR